MAEQITLHIETRDMTGTGASRRLRRAGQLPGVLYGHGDPLPIALDMMTFRRQILPEHYASAVVWLKLGNRDAGAALVKSVQKNTRTGQLLHVDLQRLSAGERVVVAVPVMLHGEPVGIRVGGMLEQLAHSVTVRCLATDVPTALELAVGELRIGDSIHAGQLTLPSQVELAGKPDEILVVLHPPRVLPVEELPVETEAVRPTPPEEQPGLAAAA